MTDDTAASPVRPTDSACCREFRGSDAMILVAGTALALSGSAHLFVFFAQELGRLVLAAAAHAEDLFAHWPAFWARTHYHLRNTLWYGMQAVEMILLGMAPAFMILRPRRPRPSRRLLIRQPGTVAVLAMVFGLFWGIGFLIVLFPERVDSMTAAPTAIGGAVAVSWLALVLSRRRQPEPGWIDRLGRSLGWAAMASGLIALIVFRI